MRTAFATSLFIALGACASSNAPPSLLPRPAEGIDPRVAVVRPMNERPADPGLSARLAELVGQARGGDATFGPAVAEAQRLAAAAGPPQSETWIAAEQALSAAIAARAPTARAMGDIDALGADRLQANGGLAPNDLAAVQQAGAEVAAIDQRQARAVASIQAQLGR